MMASPKKIEALAFTTEPSFQQVPYQVLLQRIDSGSQSLFELTNAIIERRELEEKCVLHATKISRMNIFEHEVPDSSSERVLGFFKNYHIYLSKAQVKHHKDFGESVVRDLEDLKIGRAAIINKSKVTVQNCQRDVTSAEDSLDKAKKHFQKVKQDYQRSKEKLVAIEQQVVEYLKVTEERKKENVGKEANKYNMSRMLISAFESTPELDRERQNKKVARKLQETLLAKKNIADKKRELLDRIQALDVALAKATTIFQDAEWDRVSKMKSCLKNFCSIERSLMEARSSLLATLEEAIASQSAELDIANFISHAKQSEHTHKYAHALQLLDLQMERVCKERVNSLDSTAVHKDQISTSIAENKSLSFRSQKTAGDSLTSEAVGESLGDESFSNSLNFDIKYFSEDSSSQNRENASLLDMNIGNFIDKNGLFGMSAFSSNASQTEAAGEENGESVQDQNCSIEEGMREEFLETRFSVVELECLNQMNNALLAIFPFQGAANSFLLRDHSHPVQLLDQPVVESRMMPLEGYEIEVERWAELLKLEQARELFLQELDEQRGRRAQLGEVAFRSMGNAMKAFLDFCAENKDVKSAMRIKNMANTFYTMDDVSLKEDSNRSSPTKAPADQQICNLLSTLLGSSANLVIDSPASSSSNSSGKHAQDSPPPIVDKNVTGETTSRNISPSRRDSPRLSSSEAKVRSPQLKKKYLQGDELFTTHPLWRQQGFWDAALIEGTLAQLELSDNTLISWDEMPYESLRERVIGVHNVIFGQLGSLAFAMHQSGLDYQEVESNITSMCQRCQLTEEQRFELVNSVRLIFGLTGTGTSSKSFSSPLTAAPQEIVCLQATVVDPTSMTSSDVQEYVGSSGKEVYAGVVDPLPVNEDATWAVVESNPQLQPEAIWRDGNGPTVTVATTIDKSELDVKSSEEKQPDTVTSKENLPVNSLAPPTSTKGKPVEEKSPGILSYFSSFSLTSSKPKTASKPSSMLKILSSTSSSSSSSSLPSSLAPAPSTVSDVLPSLESSPPPPSSTISSTGESINLQIASSTTKSNNNAKGFEEDLFAVL